MIETNYKFYKFLLNFSTVIQGKFNSVDASENKFRFDGWKSPVGIYDHVVIRGTDVKILEFDCRFSEMRK